MSVLTLRELETRQCSVRCMMKLQRQWIDKEQLATKEDLQALRADMYTHLEALRGDNKTLNGKFNLYRLSIVLRWLYEWWLG